MKVLIIETESLGHYLVGYIKYIIRLLTKLNFTIIILTTKKTSLHKSFKILKKENKNIQLEFIPTIKLKNTKTISLILYQLKFYFLIKRKFNIINKKYKFDHVILNSIERFDKILSILGSPFQKVKFSGIFLGLKFHLKNYNIYHQGRFDNISKYLFKRLLNFKHLKVILTNDFLLTKYVKKLNYNNYSKLHFLHEPKEFNYTFNKFKSRNELQLPHESKLILVYGALMASKGIEELILAISNNKIDKKVSVILAGTQSKEIKLFLKTSIIKNLVNKKRVFIFNGWQSEIMEAKIFASSDIVWIGYKNYSSPSGVLYQSITKNLPVIVSNDGLINYFNKKYHLGYSVNLKNSEDIIKKVNDIFIKKNLFSFLKNIKKFKKNSDPKVWMDSFKKYVLN
jgi:hypothetical protein